MYSNEQCTSELPSLECVNGERKEELSDEEKQSNEETTLLNKQYQTATYVYIEKWNEKLVNCIEYLHCGTV